MQSSKAFTEHRWKSARTFRMMLTFLKYKIWYFIYFIPKPFKIMYCVIGTVLDTIPFSNDFLEKKRDPYPQFQLSAWQIISMYFLVMSHVEKTVV